MQCDLDTVFAYDTVKLVRVLDRRAGLIYCTVHLAIGLYVVLVVFVSSKAYLDMEKTSGWILCKVMKPQISHLGIPWDVYDRVTNPGEQGAVFIPTRVLITRSQSQENQYCESPQHNCTTAEDCDVGDELVQRKECVSGHCMRRQWCPAENPTAQTTETHYLDIEQVQIWFKTFLHYHRFELDVSTADEKEPVHYPHARANTYRLRDLVRMTNYQPEEFVENGAVMILNAVFQCNLDQDNCEMKIETANVDTQTGFNHVYNHVYYEDGIRKRDSYRMFGIRIVAFTTGFGRKTSFSQIILQISSAIALMRTAELVTDFWLLNLAPERSLYLQQKVLQTEDFND